MWKRGAAGSAVSVQRLPVALPSTLHTVGLRPTASVAEPKHKHSAQAFQTPTTPHGAAQRKQAAAAHAPVISSVFLKPWDAFSLLKDTRRGVPPSQRRPCGHDRHAEAGRVLAAGDASAGAACAHVALARTPPLRAARVRQWPPHRCEARPSAEHSKQRANLHWAWMCRQRGADAQVQRQQGPLLHRRKLYCAGGRGHRHRGDRAARARQRHRQRAGAEGGDAMWQRVQQAYSSGVRKVKTWGRWCRLQVAEDAGGSAALFTSACRSFPSAPSSSGLGSDGSAAGLAPGRVPSSSGACHCHTRPSLAAPMSSTL